MKEWWAFFKIYETKNIDIWFAEPVKKSDNLYVAYDFIDNHEIGQKATAVQLEKNYYKHLKDYYANIKKLGLEYDDLVMERVLVSFWWR